MKRIEVINERVELYVDGWTRKVILQFQLLGTTLRVVDAKPWYSKGIQPPSLFPSDKATASTILY